jgi:hypothetical protein
MGQSSPFDQKQRSAREAARQGVAAAASFKPLALPALAAAVHTGKGGATRPEQRRELPPILRKER